MTQAAAPASARIIDRARAEEVMVYAIGLESDYFNGPHAVRTKPDGGLKKLAEETGGGYFELEKETELTSTFTKVAKELHSQYVLAFEPPKLDGRVHKLAIKLKQTGYTARARRSYLAEQERPSSSTRAVAGIARTVRRTQRGRS